MSLSGTDGVVSRAVKPMLDGGYRGELDVGTAMD